MKIYPLGELPEDLYPKVGGKAKGLDLLIRQHFNVPKGFVITEIDQINKEAVCQAFDALKVQQKLKLKTSLKLKEKDILRKVK